MGTIFINVADTGFNCPFCQKEYKDDKDIYLNRINQNKRGYTRIDCTGCGRPFRLTFAFDGSFISY